MKKYINLFIITVLVFSLLGLFSIVKAENTASETKGKICTMEAKQCEDGSFVSRTGPNCEFAKCSEVKEETKNKEDEPENIVKDQIEKIKKEGEVLREEAKNKFEALKESIKNEKNKAKAKIKGERITGREKALERFDNAVEKMSELKDKVDSQIIKLGLKNIDTTDAKNFVATAETKLNETKTKITEVNTLLAGSINQLSTEEKAKLLTLTTDIQSLIKETHQALNDAVKSLKDAVKAKLESLKTEDDNPAPKD